MKIIVTIYLLLVIVYSSRADWEECKGPYRGEVRKIIEYNNELFALVVNNDGTSLPSVNYVVRSTDQGINWVVVKDISKPFNSINKYTLVVVNNIIYIFNNLYNSWSSTDNGESWSKLLDNSFFHSFSRFSESLEIYDFIKIKGRYVVLTDVGLYTTDNNGKSWEKVDNFSDNIFWDWYRGPSVIGKFYDVENVLYVTTNEGLYYSEDNGDTWEKDSVTDNAVFSFNVHDGIMYVGVEGGIYRSSDKGETWEFTWIKDNIIGYFSSRNDTLYCTTSSRYMNTALGVLYSVDKGKSWIMNKLFNKIMDANILFFGKNCMLVGTYYNGMYHSSNEGKNWLQISGIPQRISALTSTQGQLLVGILRYNGLSPHEFVYRIYKSTKDRTSWLLNDFQQCVYSPGQTRVTSFVVKDSNVFANIEGNGLYCFEGICTSIDFGEKWKCDNSLGYLRSNRRIFKKPLSIEDTLFVYDANNSFFSTDNGESWDTLSRKLTLYDNYVIAKAGKYFSLDKSLYVSNNRGVTWSELKIDGLEEYYCLYEHEGTIYVSTDKGIYSTQDGIHWQNYGLSTMKASSLVVVDNYLYAGTDYGLYKRELLPSSIEEISFDSSIQLYPNPAQEFLYIKANTPYDTVSVYSILGDKVMDIVTSKDVIDISSLESGYYQVIVQSQTLQQRASLSIMR